LEWINYKMPKTIWLVKYKYDGSIHTDGYCTGSEGNEEIEGIQYRFTKYPPTEFESITDEWITNESILDKLKDKQHMCRVEGGSGYCNAFIHYKAIWARKVNKRKNREFLIISSNEAYYKLFDK